MITKLLRTNVDREHGGSFVPSCISVIGAHKTKKVKRVETFERISYLQPKRRSGDSRRSAKRPQDVIYLLCKSGQLLVGYRQERYQISTAADGKQVKQVLQLNVCMQFSLFHSPLRLVMFLWQKVYLEGSRGCCVEVTIMPRFYVRTNESVAQT